MRATWSGMISLGLVNIPVQIFTVAREEKTSFHQMHKKDSGRVRYQKVCGACGEILDTDDIIKGYEYKKGQYVLITDEELDKINLDSNKSINIQSFVDSSEIDTLQFDKAFYIAPDENGERAYVLLRQALRETGKAGIGKVVFRTREQLAAVWVKNDALVLEILHYADEMIKKDELGIPAADAQLVENELKLAKILVDQMTSSFDPAAYHDEYENALREIINKKIEGEEVTAPPQVQPTEIIDIVSALKASLAGAEAIPEKSKKSA